MIKAIEITNYKSIENLTIELGQVTVLIGENGSGKSNILEALALASAGAKSKLNNEFLTSRGVRITDPQLMRAGFDSDNVNKDIELTLYIKSRVFKYALHHNNESYSQWSFSEWLNDKKTPSLDEIEIFLMKLKELELEINRPLGIDINQLIELYQYTRKATQNISLENAEQSNQNEEKFRQILSEGQNFIKKTTDDWGLHYRDFLIYAPENTALRNFYEEGQIQPLGVKGEGLFKLLSVMSREPEKGHFAEVKAQLQLFDWFDDFDMPNNLFPGERRLQIKDRYLDETIASFDQRSANEGFLYLLFYFTLFISDYTPQFFAIDNIDASLNPKLCQRLIQELVMLAKKHGKQVIMTTHNPAILDGLDLTDEAQKLHVVYRNLMGQTKVRPVAPAQPPEGEAPIRLSEAFLKGYLGGLPQNF